jgi:hypothetical protein
MSTFPAGDESASGLDDPPQIRVVLNWFSELQQRFL